MDLPTEHPDFGKLTVCTCRQPELQDRLQDQLFIFSQLDELKEFTFDTFNPGGRVGTATQQADSLERAFNQALAFAQTPQDWLLLQGPYGCGKTHLAAAIANQAVQNGLPTLFLTVPDLLDALRFSFEAEDVTFEERFDQIRTAPLLILDDFGTQNATEWAQEKLFQILNYRYINKLPLVVTTNLPLDQLEGRIRSRLSDPDHVSIVSILAPDYRRPVDDTGQYELSSLPLHSQQTFGTFNMRQGERLGRTELSTLEGAFEAAQKFSENPVGWLVLMGPYGSGKTHLAAAVANYRSSQGHPVMFVVVPDMLDHLRATFNPNSSVSYDRRFDEIRTANLLVLDDLGTQAMRPWVREKLYQLFNYRYQAELPTVITTAESLEELDPRIRSRMEDRRICQIKPITAPAFRGKTSSKRSKR
jgi:DNA replication protein DnaC